MAFIHGRVAVEEIDQKRWRLLEPVVYRGNRQIFTVPIGFVTDFATVPQAFTWLIPRYGKYTKAAILHDYLCREKPVDRADADGIFRRVMRELGVSFLRRWMMWAAVRFGSALKGISSLELIQWLSIALPSLVFLLIPGVIVLLWSAIFWLAEGILYLLLKPFSKKQVNPPIDFGIEDE